MSDAGRAPDTADWNPVFAQRLAAFRDALTKAGINSSIASGYRSPEYQDQMYQNHLAKQAKQPLPYPDVEAPSVVAPAWRSFHNYGIAADLHLDNPNDYARMAEMARQFGLSGIGPNDPGHIQLAGTLADDIKQYNLAGWRPDARPAPDTGAIAYQGGPPAGQPPASLQARGSYAYYGLNNPGNIGFSPWTEQHGGKTSSASDTGHQIASFPDLATGYAAMNELALNKYRGGATTLNQLIAGKNGWTPNNTIAAGNIAKMLGISPDDDLGLNDSAKMAAFQRALTQQETGSSRQYDAFKSGTPAPTSPVPGTTLTSVPVHPHTLTPPTAGPQYTPNAVAAANAPAAPSFGQAIASGDVGGAIKAALTKPPPTTDAKGNQVEGKSPLEKLASTVGSVAEKPAPAAPTPQPIMPAQDPDPGLAPAASQLFQTVAQSAARPLSWSSVPYGANAGLIRPGGTTLNATDYGGAYG